MNPEEYNTNSDNHGSYQYVSLKDIVDDFLAETLDDDSILKNIKRSKIVRAVKKAIRELSKDTFNQVKAIEITVPESLYFVLPYDFVTYVRSSLVVEDKATDSYRLRPIEVNQNINIATGYLQDSDSEILFDSDGNVLTSDASNGYNIPYKKYQFETNGGFFIRNYGECIIDERSGKILFSSDLSDKEIVLEYLSDGLQYDTYKEDEIKVLKTMLNALNEYVYFLLIQYR